MYANRLFGTIVTLGMVLTGCHHAVEPPPNENPIPTDEAPSWSPDGKWIAYTHFSTDLNDTTYPTGLYVIDTDGTNRRLVIAGFASNPDWSADGKKIAFNGGDIFTITPTRDGLTQITDVGSAFFPAWSPDGKRIAFDTPYQDPKGANAI
jgi:Tol biopolymer transport system component